MKTSTHRRKQSENQTTRANLQNQTQKSQNKITKLPLCLNREAIRGKWKFFMTQKLHKAFIRSATDVNILSHKYMSYFLLKQKIFFKIWKNHKKWRKFSAQLLLNNRTSQLKEEFQHSVPKQWERIVEKLHKEIKSDNFINALSEHQLTARKQEYFDKWKQAYDEVLLFREDMKETWFDFLKRLKQIDFDEKVQEGKEALQHFYNWKYFSNQLQHNILIGRLTAEHDHLFYHRKWKHFIRDFKHLDFQFNLEDAYRNYSLRKRWMDFKDDYLRQSILQQLFYEKENLSKAMGLFDMISRYVKMSRQKTLTEARDILKSKQTNTKLVKYFNKWQITSSAVHLIKTVSKTSFDTAFEEYSQCIANYNASVIQNWFRRTLKLRNNERKITEKYFMLWRAKTIHVFPNHFPELDATIEYKPTIDEEIPIHLSEISLEPIRHLYDFYLSNKERGVLKPFEYEDGPSRFSFLIPYECVDLINTFAPTDVVSIVRAAISQIDFVGPYPIHELPDEDEKAPNDTYNMSDDFYVALSHSDFGANSDDAEEESSILASNNTNNRPSIIESFGFSFETDSMIQDNTELLVPGRGNEKPNNEEESTSNEDSEEMIDFTFDNTIMNTSLTTTMNIEVVNIIQNSVLAFDVLIEKENIQEVTEKPKFVEIIPQKVEERKIPNTEQALSPLPYSYEVQRRVSFPNLPASSETSSEYMSYDQTSSTSSETKPQDTRERTKITVNQPNLFDQNEIQTINKQDEITESPNSFEIFEVSSDQEKQTSSKQKDSHLSFQSFNQVDEAPINKEPPLKPIEEQQESRCYLVIDEEDENTCENTLEDLVKMAQQLFKQDERALRQSTSSSSIQVGSGDQETSSSDYSSHQITIDESFLEYVREGEKSQNQAKPSEVDVFDTYEMAFTATLYSLSDSLVTKQLQTIHFGPQLTSQEKYFIEVESSDSEEMEKQMQNSNQQKIKQTVDVETYETLDQSKEPESKDFFSLQIPSQEMASIPQAHNIDLPFIQGTSNQFNDADVSPPSKMTADVSKETHSLEKAQPTRVLTKVDKLPAMMTPKVENTVSSSAIISHEISKEESIMETSFDDSFLAPESQQQEETEPSKTKEQNSPKQDPENQHKPEKESQRDHKISKDETIESTKEKESPSSQDNKQEQQKEDGDKTEETHDTAEETKEKPTKHKTKKKTKKSKTKKSKKTKEVTIDKVAPTFADSLTKCIMPAVTIAIKKSLLFDMFCQNDNIQDEYYSYDYSTDQKDSDNSKQSVVYSISQDLHYDESVTDQKDKTSDSIPDFKPNSPKYRVDSPIVQGPPITDYSTYETGQTSTVGDIRNNNAQSIVNTKNETNSFSESDAKPEKQTVNESDDESHSNEVVIKEPPKKASKLSFVDGMMNTIDDAVARIMPMYADIRFSGLSHIYDRSTPSIYESALANLSPKVTSSITPRKTPKHSRSQRGNSTITTTTTLNDEDSTISTEKESSKPMIQKQRLSAIKQPTHKKDDEFHLRITKGISKEIIGIITNSLQNAVKLSIPPLVATVGELKGDT